MGYRKYNTPGLILDRVTVGEADTFFFIYTRDLGRVGATARSVRTMKSKLRYALQPYTFVEISLVRGKQIWRITNAIAGRNLYSELSDTPQKLAVFLNVVALIRRLVRGEQADPELYQVLENGFSFLADNQLEEDEVRRTELLIVLRVLECLGYLREDDHLASFTGDASYSVSMLDLFSGAQKEALSEINRTLNTIHL